VNLLASAPVSGPGALAQLPGKPNFWYRQPIPVVIQGMQAKNLDR